MRNIPVHLSCVLVAMCLVGFGGYQSDPLPTHYSTPVEHEQTYASYCTDLPAKYQAATCSGTSRFDQLVVAAAQEFCIDPSLLAQTVYRESGCNPKKVGTSGEVGWAQVHPDHWLPELCSKLKICNLKTLKDPWQNLRAASYILAKLSHTSETGVWGVFRRYNGGGPQARAYATEQAIAYAAKFDGPIQGCH